MPARIGHLRVKYSMTEEHYEWLLEKQGNCCALCKSNDPQHKSGRFCIDHCHKTSKVRGLLCNACNMGLGKFKDNVDALAEAITYIINNGYSDDLESANLSQPTRKPSGQVNKRKIGWEEAEEIRYLYKTGSTQQAIAEYYGITQAAVSRVIIGKVWNRDTRLKVSGKIYGGKKV